MIADLSASELVDDVRALLHVLACTDDDTAAVNETIVLAHHLLGEVLKKMQTENAAPKTRPQLPTIGAACDKIERAESLITVACEALEGISKGDHTFPTWQTLETARGIVREARGSLSAVAK